MVGGVRQIEEKEEEEDWESGGAKRFERGDKRM